jgi:hypothetical protein
MVIRIGDIEMKMSKVTFAYKCFLLSFALSAFAFGEVMTFHLPASEHVHQLSPLQAGP